MTRTWMVLASMGSTLGLVACIAQAPIGHGEPTNDAGSGESADADVHPSLDGAKPEDAASHGDSSSNADASTASGYVEISPNGPQPGAYQLQVVGLFWSGAPAGTPASCQSRTVGACIINRCPVATVASSSAAQSLSAGELTVGSLHIAPEVDSDAGLPVTIGYEGAQGVWPVGQSVHIAASGAAFPAFAGDLIAPSTVTVTEPPGPATPSETNLTGGLSKSGVTLAWTPLPAPNRLVAEVRQAFGNPVSSELTVDCNFDGTLGSASIPAAALSDLSTDPESPTGPLTDLLIATMTAVTAVAGGDLIVLYGSAPGVDFIVPSTGVSP
jgi:hypothetical protein